MARRCAPSLSTVMSRLPVAHFRLQCGAIRKRAGCSYGAPISSRSMSRRRCSFHCPTPRRAALAHPISLDVEWPVLAPLIYKLKPLVDRRSIAHRVGFSAHLSTPSRLDFHCRRFATAGNACYTGHRVGSGGISTVRCCTNCAFIPIRTVLRERNNVGQEYF